MSEYAGLLSPCAHPYGRSFLDLPLWSPEMVYGRGLITVRVLNISHNERIVAISGLCTGV